MLLVIMAFLGVVIFMADGKKEDNRPGETPGSDPNTGMLWPKSARSGPAGDECRNLKQRAELLKQALEEVGADEEIIASSWVSGVTIPEAEQGTAGVILATSQRLIFSHMEKTGGQVVAFPYNSISEFEVTEHSRAIGIRFRALGKAVEIRRIFNQRERIVRAVKEGMPGKVPDTRSEI